MRLIICTFWIVAPCSLLQILRILKTEAADFSNSSPDFHQTTRVVWNNVSEDGSFHGYRCESLQSRACVL